MESLFFLACCGCVSFFIFWLWAISDCAEAKRERDQACAALDESRDRCERLDTALRETAQSSTHHETQLCAIRQILDRG